MSIDALFDRVTGAEELGLSEDGAGAVVEAVEEARAEVAELAVEIEEQSAVLEEVVEQIEELDESVEELEEVVEGVESLIGSGSYNPTAFGILYARGQALNAKLGGQNGDRLGAESLADRATAEMAARQGVEGFVETIKKYGQQAIEFVKHIFNVMITFFVSLFNQADGLQRRAASLKAKVEKSSDNERKKKIKLGPWNAYFDYAKGGLTGSKEKGTQGPIEAIGGLLEAAKSVDGLTVANFTTAYAKVKESIKTAAASFGRAEQKKVGKEAVSIAQMAAIRFRASYQEEAIKELSDIPAAARALKIVISKDAALAKKLSSGEVASKTDKAGLLAAIKDVETGVGLMRGIKVEKKFGAAERDRIVGHLQAASKTSDEAKAKEINEQIKGVRAIFGTAAQVTQTISKGLSASLRATLDAVAAHV